jgi:hypothetical protein
LTDNTFFVGKISKSTFRFKKMIPNSWNWKIYKDDPLEEILWNYIASRGDLKTTIVGALKDRYLAIALAESGAPPVQVRQTCFRSLGVIRSQEEILEELYFANGGKRLFSFAQDSSNLPKSLTKVEPADSTTQPTNVESTDSTTQPTNVEPADSTTQPTNVESTDSTTQPTNVESTDSTTQPTNVEPADSTTQPTNVEPADFDDDYDPVISIVNFS